MLSSVDNGAVVVQRTGHVEQSKQDPVGTDPKEIVKVTGHALPIVDRGQVRLA
ncbi:MAG: hypothetical protein LAO09_19195 [Acidobacteriia bacterium]|nr:hypothetical protein [Terriglobia bacterium]